MSAMAVFIEYPLLAAVIGGLLLGLGRWMRRRTAVGAGILWLLYAAYETGMRQRWLCSGECNIRVDLLLIYPLLLLALVAAVVSLLRRRVVPILLLSLGSTVAMAQARTDRPGQRPRLPLDLLPDTLAICRLDAAAAVPPWAAASSRFLTISRTADELSITATEASVPADARCERDYRAFRVRGPLPLDLIGILASIAEPLAEAGLSIFAISTYDTDYVLVKGRDLDAAVRALKRAGHQVTG